MASYINAVVSFRTVEIHAGGKLCLLNSCPCSASAGCCLPFPWWGATPSGRLSCPRRRLTPTLSVPASPVTPEPEPEPSLFAPQDQSQTPVIEEEEAS